VSPNAKIYAANATSPNAGDFTSTLLSDTSTYTLPTTTVNGTPTPTVYPNSFIDSGSNGIYLPGTGIPADPKYGWFIPVVAVSAQNPTADMFSIHASQQGAGGGNTNIVDFKIANANTVLFPSGIGNNTVLNGLGAASSGDTSSVGGVDWGLPFFLGKSIFVGLEANTITIGNVSALGPFWAY
jgi:hypothetical protein